MRSRWHAIGAGIVAAVLPLMGWVGTVIIALVCLQYGLAAGALVLLWVLLPVGVVLYYSGDPSPLFALLGTFVMALLLRQTLSWELVLMASVVLSALGALIFEFTAASLLDEFVEVYIGYLKQFDANVAAAPEVVRTLLMGFIALGQAYAMLIMLIIARWCQSALYRPGGLREEFHQLRLSPMVSMGILVLMLACYLFSEEPGRWLPLLTVPLIFAALGLAHWLMANRGLSRGWVAVFYGVLVLFVQLVYPLLASMALADTWLDVRKRIQTTHKD